jgi:hypothetical protein
LLAREIIGSTSEAINRDEQFQCAILDEQDCNYQFVARPTRPRTTVVLIAGLL